MARKKQGLIQQTMLKNKYQKELQDLVSNVFKWTTSDPIFDRKIEQLIYNSGYVIAFYEEEFGDVVVLPATAIGMMDRFSEPTAYQVMYMNKTRVIKAEDCVKILDKPSGEPPERVVELYASMMAEVKMTQRQNIYNLRQPFIVQGTQNQAKMLRDLFEIRESFEPFIVAGKELGDNPISLFLTPSTYICKDLQEYLQDLRSEFLAQFGIDSVSIHKKERLITAEAEANNDQVALMRATRMNMRQLAIEQIKEKFGVEWKCEFVEVDLDDLESENDSTQEGDNNGELHD